MKELSFIIFLETHGKTCMMPIWIGRIMVSPGFPSGLLLLVFPFNLNPILSKISVVPFFTQVNFPATYSSLLGFWS